MKNMSIRFKILIPVCILGILAILIAAYDSASVDSMQDGITELQQVGIEALSALDQTSIATQKMGKMALAYTQLQGEGKEAVWGQVESANATIEEQLAIARSVLTSDGAQEGLNAIKAATDELYSTVKHLKECVDSGDTEQVTQIIRNDMNTVSTAAESVINEVINYNYADIEEIRTYQHKVYVWASVISTEVVI